MKTVEELVYYCHECEPVGALLLSGEWGCGKTHLIEHELKDALADTSVVLRISLFGMTLPEEIHVTVRREWMAEYCKIKGIDKVTEKIGQGKEWLSKMDFLPEWIRGIAKNDASVFFPISKEIDGKEVILVFDDLERCRMSSVDVLGVINDYCENQHYHTIIVANQAKIKGQREITKITGEIQQVSAESDTRKSENTKAVIKVDIPVQPDQAELSYAEIREKIIQRTVYYLPDYENIVHAVIATAKFQSAQYREFVISCEGGLLELFAPDRDDLKFENSQSDDKGQSRPTPPHNIRSLKCAIKDFYRLYNILQKNDFSELDKWLYSFTSYVIAYKAGIARADDYSTLFSDKDVRKMYPAFQSNYTINSVKQWVLNGVWNENAITSEIEIIKKRNNAQSAPEIIKSNRIIDIDDAVIHEGFADFLEIAYNGNLTLDEYVLLIENSRWARSYECDFPLPIDWKKVQAGIGLRIAEIKKTLPEGQLLFSTIAETRRSDFTDEEWSTYELISKFVLGNELIFYRNKKLYIDKIRELGLSAFMFIENKRYDVFDEEMATATAQAFSQENNAGKNQFISNFKNLWEIRIQSSDIRIEDSIKGFHLLKAYLQEALAKVPQGKRDFSIVHTERFVNILSKLIDIYKEELSKCEDSQDT
ncbi:MAG: P-loop NTPase fold protein [Butyricicoccus sp.]